MEGFSTRKIITVESQDAARPPIRKGSALGAGARVADYVVTGMVASGGFGSIYRVEDLSNGRPAAMKALHEELLWSPEALICFEREIRALNQLRHPNVVQIYEVGHLDDGRPYFTMELLKGMDLEAYLRSVGRLTPSEVVGILGPLCDALGAAHERGIIHRDVKASNVFLAEEGDARRVVLLDFGVSKLLGDKSSVLSSSWAMGTPTCMAPEQITGKKIDGRADVYGLGSLVFHMLTGRLPFEAASGLTMAQMHLQSPRPRPSAIAPIDPAFDEVTARAMSVTRDERYGTARELVAAFSDTMVRASTSPNRPVTSRALGVHLTVRVAPDARRDARLEAELMAIAAARQALAAAGFVTVLDDPMNGFWVRRLEHDIARAEAVDAVLAIFRRLNDRTNREPRVRMCLALHVAEADFTAGRPVGGELMHIEQWAPAPGVQGVIGSPRAIAGLGIHVQPIYGTTRFVRVRG